MKMKLIQTDPSFCFANSLVLVEDILLSVMDDQEIKITICIPDIKGFYRKEMIKSLLHNCNQN